MNIYSYFKSKFTGILIELIDENLLPKNIPLNLFSVEPPKDKKHGDMASNICLALAKNAYKKPMDLAPLIINKLEKFEEVQEIFLEKPGFINFNLHKKFWHDQIKLILKNKKSYGERSLVNNQSINIEFVSANPTGPLHVGHVRGAVLGDSLANILSKVGYSVIREYYVNDAGNQVNILAHSVFLRYKEILTCKKVQIPEGFYPGEYLIPIAQNLIDKFQDKLLNQELEKSIKIIKEISIDWNLKNIKDDLKKINILMDVYTSEKDLVERSLVDRAIKNLELKKLIYYGTLPKPKNSKNLDWEPKIQKLFRATEYGDDEDRTICKSDGSFTYFASDVAFHMDKLYRTDGLLVNIWGADHGGYVKRMLSAVSAITGKDKQLEIKLCQMVNLIKNGKSIKMSKRSGTFVTLREIIEQVGGDAVRFIMLTRRNDQALDFDIDKVTEKSKENPVFYVQYAHARMASVLRKAKELGFNNRKINEATLDLLVSQEQVGLCRILANWPKVLESAANNYEPHRIAFYLIELASNFHSYWSLGREKKELRFFQEDNEANTLAGLALVKSCKYVLHSGLETLSVDAPEEM